MVIAKILIPAILFVCNELPKTTSHEEAFENSRVDKLGFIPTGNETNSSNVSTSCYLKIDKLSLKKILQLIRHKKKNAIELNVWLKSFNNTLNETRVLPGITWANEIGRTLISLIAAAENATQMILSSYTSTLTVGVVSMDIVVTEMSEGCLSFSGKNASDVVFNFLLFQLYPHEDGSDYQLCVKHTSNGENHATKYNCCSLLEQDTKGRCSIYSPPISTDIFSVFFIGTGFLLISMVVSLTMEQLHNDQKECIKHKISDNPMSLLSIFRMIFIDGYGLAKSFGRRMVIVAVVLVTFLPIEEEPASTIYMGPMYSIFLLGFWTVFFLFNSMDALRYYRRYQVTANSYIFFASHRNPIKIIALPFNLKFFWNLVNRRSFFRGHSTFNLNSDALSQESANNHQITERSRLLPQGELPPEPRKGVIIGHVCKYCLSILVLPIVYLLILPFLCLFALFTFVIGRFFQYFTGKKYVRMATIVSLYQLGFFSLAVLGICFWKWSLLAFYFIAGLLLNAEYFSAYFAPISIILFYSWSNWRLSVETKYLGLNTKIYKLCQESSNPVQVTRPVGETADHSIDTDSSQTRSAGHENHRRFQIKLDENGEPLIPKPLYDIVRERFLPYDEILVPFFGGVLFVVMFAYVLYTFLSLAQTSGVSTNVQIIGTMAATSLPFLFDLIWKKNTSEQKEANNLAWESKLRHALTVCSSNVATGEITVEFTGAISTDPFGNHDAS